MKYYSTVFLNRKVIFINKILNHGIDIIYQKKSVYIILPRDREVDVLEKPDWRAERTT